MASTTKASIGPPKWPQPLCVRRDDLREQSDASAPSLSLAKRHLFPAARDEQHRRYYSMTCGACAPEMFRETESGRVFGYLVAPTMDMATLLSRKLYFLGAEGVFSDYPKGNIRHRPGWRILNKILHPGDQLLLLNAKALGSKPEYVRRNQKKLESDGINVAFVVTDYFEGHPP